MVTASTMTPRLQLGRALRERFLTEMTKAMTELSGVVQARLTELVDEPASARDSQIRRDVWMAYKKCRPQWLDNTLKAWRECLEPVPDKKQNNVLESAGLELVGTDVVENKIMASRLVMTVNDKVFTQLDDLRVRVKLLENLDDLDARDLLRPEVMVLLMVEQWTHCGMQGDSWPLINDVVQAKLIICLNEAYKNGNTLLISKGVLPTIELKDRVRAPVRAAPRPRPPPQPLGRVHGPSVQWLAAHPC